MWGDSPVIDMSKSQRLINQPCRPHCFKEEQEISKPDPCMKIHWVAALAWKVYLSLFLMNLKNWGKLNKQEKFK